MTDFSDKTYLFCGVGGSGMSALALICKQKGARVFGSDRAYDQGQSCEKFEALTAQGIELVPQDGSGVLGNLDALIVSSAVEDSIPDVAAAKAQGVPIIKRAELLAGMFNASECGISVAGTSGKSTVTGMVAHVLMALDHDPTVMNGAVIKSLESNMRVGAGPFVTETDESDGTIALYEPDIAVVNNIAIDHMSMGELEKLFGNFISRAKRAVVLNFDDQRLKMLAGRAQVPVISYQLADAPQMNLQVPGRHNVSNALACLAVCEALEIERGQAITALEGFTGIKRRMELVGEKNGITVLDDFAHNPDKIAATLSTLKETEGRIIVMFQPHGFGPLKLMGHEIAQSFADHMDEDDILIMPDPYYAGGTADRSVGGKDVIGWAEEQGVNAHWFETRSETQPLILEQAREGDRIVIMGARDDTLSDFAAEILEKV